MKYRQADRMTYEALPAYSTGISLASICNAKGYKLKIVMPDDQSVEKRQLLERYELILLQRIDRSAYVYIWAYDESLRRRSIIRRDGENLTAVNVLC